MSDFTIAKIGEVTSNGNRIVKIQRKVETEDMFGVTVASETYYRAVKADSVKVSEGDVITGFDPSNYRVVERDSELTDKDTGEMITVTLKWLHNKA